MGGCGAGSNFGRFEMARRSERPDVADTSQGTHID